MLGRDRSQDYLLAQTTNTGRWYSYDNRHNLREVLGYLSDGWTGTYLYTHTSGFDDRGRRVFKQFTWMGDASTWFFYYDARDRLTEVRVTRSWTSDYSVFQLVWLDDRLIAYYQTDYPTATTAKRAGTTTVGTARAATKTTAATAKRTASKTAAAASGSR